MAGGLKSPGLAVASVITFATALAYGWLIGQQQALVQPPVPIAGRVVMVGTAMALFGLACGVGAFMDSTPRAVCAAIAWGGLLPLGFLAIFSVGLPLLVAGIVALAAGLQALPKARPRTAGWTVGTAGASAFALAIGFLLT